MQENEKSDGVELFKHADEKIDRLKNEVSVLVQKHLELTLKIDHLTGRIDNGMAITGQKTLEKVTGLVTQIATFATALEKQENTIKDHQKLLDRIQTGIFWISFVGVGGGFVATLFLAVKGFHP